MVSGNEIPAYNIPSGILFDMHREAAAKRPGVLTKIGMDTFADPAREGCAMNAKRRREPIVSQVDFAGDDWLFFRRSCPMSPSSAPPRPTNAAIFPMSMKAAISARSIRRWRVRNNGGIVIAQVKRLANIGSSSRQHVFVPGILVDAIVVAPGPDADDADAL